MDEQPFQFQPINDDSRPFGLKKRAPRRGLIVVAIIFIIAIALLVAAAASYKLSLRPLDVTDSKSRTLKVEPGATPGQIASELDDKDLIRSALAFRIYIRLHGVENSLQAGVYDVKRNQSTPEIVATMHEGRDIQNFEVTFLPGGTLEEGREVLQEAGFDARDVDEALSQTYASMLFQSKPSDADLEGYLYGETHQFPRGTSAQQVLKQFFTDFNEFIKDNSLESAYQKQGLSLYEGITLASIIQREARGGEEKQIAQVFFKRLAKDIQLGSDVTYQYAADKQGVTRDINLDSPYNTRRYKGLPPGPIATPGRDALLAVAHPAKGGYLYFVHGDNDEVHFSNTEAEHDTNVERYCQTKCQIM